MSYTDLRVRAGSQRWHKMRNTGIGASEIAAVLGLSPFMSATTLYYRKRGDLPDERDNARMEWGRRLERMIFQRWLEDHPTESYTWGRMYRSDERPWQLATPDGLAWLQDEQVVVEIKTAASKDGWGEDGSDEIPIYYRAQVMQQMDVVGARVAHVPCLFNGREYRTYQIPYDHKDATIMRARGAAFWDRVVNGAPPPLDAHKSTTKAMRSIWDMDPAKEVLIPTDLAQKYDRARRLKDQIDALVDRYDNEIRHLTADAAKIYADGRTVATRSAWTERRIDSKRLREARPDIWEEFAKVSTRQRFNWKGLNNGG